MITYFDLAKADLNMQTGLPQCHGREESPCADTKLSTTSSTENRFQA